MKFSIRVIEPSVLGKQEGAVDSYNSIFTASCFLPNEVAHSLAEFLMGFPPLTKSP